MAYSWLSIIGIIMVMIFYIVKIEMIVSNRSSDSNNELEEEQIDYY